METNDIIGAVSEKKEEAPKKTTKKPATAKKAEPKTTAVKEEVKAEVKATAKKTVAKKPAAKKTTTKAADNKPAAKKMTTRKTALKKEVFVQYYENQVDEETLVQRVLEDCKEQNVVVKDLKMYLKPEDNACYYVANGNVAGKVDLF